MSRSLPSHPSLEYLRKQAKDLLRAHKSGDGGVCDTLRLHHRFAGASKAEMLVAKVSLQEVQHALALHYGFKNWADLRKHVQAEERKGKISIHEELEEKGNKAADDIARWAIKDGTLLEDLFDAANSSNKKIKNAAAKALKLISETEPVKLCPSFGFFADLIERDDTILRWIGMDVIGNLSYVDTDNRLGKKLLGRLLSFLSDEAMITAAHSIDNLWKIALNKPQYQKQITAELLKVDSVARHQQCHNILAGRRILAFAECFDVMDDIERGQVASFARGHLKNSRNATRKKAEKFLKQFQKV